MTAVPCPGHPDHANSKRLVALEGGREIRRCTTCSLVFAHPMPSAAELTAYYQGFTFGKPTAEAVAKHREIIHANVRKIVEDLKQAGCRFGSALDFGGGLGYYSDAFADHFDEVALFDLDAEAVDYTKQLFPGRFRVETTRSGEVPTFGRTYDLIFANQVIEHYTDLDLFFRTLLSAAHEDTIFVITTPNNASANIWVRPDMLLHYSTVGTPGPLGRISNIAGLARDSWACCDPPRHVFAFNPENLQMIAEQHGIATEKVMSMYCTRNYYSPPKYQPASGKSSTSIIRNMVVAPIRAGIRTLGCFDKDQQRGDDVVFVGKKDKCD